jgi:hypothetical protein
VSRREDGLRSVLVRVLELLEDGAVDEAQAFLRSALRRARSRRYRCGWCGSSFAFPGELEEHLRRSWCGGRAGDDWEGRAA